MFVSENSELAPWRSINSTFGVSELMSFECKPKSLPLQLISGLMLRCDASGTLRPPKVWTRETVWKCSPDLLPISLQALIQSIPNSVSGYSWISWIKKHVCSSLQINCNSLNRFLPNFWAFSIHRDLFGRPNECLNIRVLCKHIRSVTWNHFLNLHWPLADEHSAIGILLKCG